MISLALALRYDRKLTETLPSGVCIFMLLAYLLGISGHISHITELLLLYEASGIAYGLYLILVKKKKDITDPFMDPGIPVMILILMAAWFLSLHMRVTNFDDFHSWAITPKDIFYVNGLPTGGMASTFYRDYFPVVYFMDYLMFLLLGRFSESAMFFVLWALMIISLSEFFHRRKEDDVIRYILRVSAGIMLPFLFSFQFLHCLGTDILAATFFGAAMIYIMKEDPDDHGTGGTAFFYIRLVPLITVLAMLKTTSAVLTAVCVMLYCVRFLHPKQVSSWLKAALLPACSVAFWLSWKIFCSVKGNTTYLSDNLNNNLTQGSAGIPYYAASTIKDFISRLFTYGLNDGTTGLTSGIIVLVFVGAFAVYIRENGRTLRNVLAPVTILLGMTGYLLMMIYVYLFVFEEWEALSLSSYDRYIATYFGAMLCLVLYMLYRSKIMPSWGGIMLALVLAFTINYPYVARTMIPSAYEKEFGGVIESIDAIEEEFLAASGGMPGYGESILAVDHTRDQLRAKVIPYAAVPGVTRLVQPDENGKMPDEAEIREMADEYDARIIELK